MSRAVLCGLTTPHGNGEVVACHLAIEPCSKGALVSRYSWGVRSTWPATLEKLPSLETSISSTHHAPCVEVCDSQKTHNVMTTSVTTIFFLIQPPFVDPPPWSSLKVDSTCFMLKIYEYRHWLLWRHCCLLTNFDLQHEFQYGSWIERERKKMQKSCWKSPSLGWATSYSEKANIVCLEFEMNNQINQMMLSNSKYYTTLGLRSKGTCTTHA